MSNTEVQKALKWAKAIHRKLDFVNESTVGFNKEPYGKMLCSMKNPQLEKKLNQIGWFYNTSYGCHFFDGTQGSCHNGDECPFGHTLVNVLQKEEPFFVKETSSSQCDVIVSPQVQVTNNVSYSKVLKKNNSSILDDKIKEIEKSLEEIDLYLEDCNNQADILSFQELKKSLQNKIVELKEEFKEEEKLLKKNNILEKARKLLDYKIVEDKPAESVKTLETQVKLEKTTNIVDVSNLGVKKVENGENNLKKSHRQGFTGKLSPQSMSNKFKAINFYDSESDLSVEE